MKISLLKKVNETLISMTDIETIIACIQKPPQQRTYKELQLLSSLITTIPIFEKLDPQELT